MAVESPRVNGLVIRPASAFNPSSLASVGPSDSPAGEPYGTEPYGAGRGASYGSNDGELRMKLNTGMLAAASSICVQPLMKGTIASVMNNALALARFRPLNVNAHLLGLFTHRDRAGALQDVTCLLSFAVRGHEHTEVARRKRRIVNHVR